MFQTLDGASFACCSALFTAVFFSIWPLSLAFWDPGSRTSWKQLYEPTDRAQKFAAIANVIPVTARVASTDFVHTRYTHHERSYDFSEYARRVSDGELRVPHDTDYIVIDTNHPYSIYHSVEEIRDYQNYPERWEVLPDTTDGYFIILKRNWEVDPLPHD